MALFTRCPQKQCRSKKGKNTAHGLMQKKVCRQEKEQPQKAQTPNGMKAATATKSGQVGIQKAPAARLAKCQHIILAP